nr:GPR1/FUN34/YaaH family transporter [Streptomyces sp. 2231.1]
MNDPPTSRPSGQPPARTPHPAVAGDPAPLGLAGFALTTPLLSVINTNLLKESAAVIPVLALALFCGGLTQVRRRSVRVPPREHPPRDSSPGTRRRPRSSTTPMAARYCPSAHEGRTARQRPWRDSNPRNSLCRLVAFCRAPCRWVHRRSAKYVYA